MAFIKRIQQRQPQSEPKESIFGDAKFTACSTFVFSHLDLLGDIPDKVFITVLVEVSIVVSYTFLCLS